MNPEPSIGELLVERSILDRDVLDAALHEQRLTGDGLGTILVRNGLVNRKRLISVLADVPHPELLSEPVDTDRIPVEVLYGLRVMILRETPERLFLASPGPHWYIEDRLRPYFPDGCRFYWLDYDPVVFEQHMHRLAVRSRLTDLERILRDAVMQEASDVHLIPKPAAYTLMHRRLGVREVVRDLSLEAGTRLVAQAKDRAGADMAERALPQDGSFRISMLERLVDFRIATLPEAEGERLVIRILDPEAAHPDLESLGFRSIDPWLQAVRQPHGLCLVCGPTGSGKSTTLNATLRRLDRFGQSIHTVEDPVELRMSYIGQVETRRVRGLDFPRALRGFMRADPDVIVVGEIRDFETAKLAVQAAETGHMVLATLHADNPHGALVRMRDLGVPIEDFAWLLKAVLAQKLVRTLCPHCEGQGCPACHHQGFAGRTLVSEVATFGGSGHVRQVLEGDRWWPTLHADAEALIDAGITTREEVRRRLGVDPWEHPAT